MAPHTLRRQICHRHLGLDAHPRPPRSLPALGYGLGPLQKGIQNLVGLPARHMARAHRDRRYGWIHRVQERRRRRTPRRKGSHGPLSTSYTSPATPWTSAADAPGKNSTTSAGAPRTPSSRPAGYLHTRSCLLTPHQQHRILDLFASDCHVTLEVTWSANQNITRHLPRSQQNPR